MKQNNPVLYTYIEGIQFMTYYYGMFRNVSV
jgi:hypothetical protein